ncbi:MAG: hypothetical protein M1817_004112 [Caeruleum heppii]|nr:MAG: hypothetical protein M1817_004112 [Caeruleum heppii]
MGQADGQGTIFSATYSNVPVYEYNVNGNHVMRRRSDDWINATHILKVADFDKPARTRILEREVQKGVHEKVQGGYGKYQGTWVPLSDGRDLAERNKVLDKLLPIFDYVPGDRSPPQAPKHTTAASSKPRVPKAAPVRRAPMPASSQISEDLHDNMSPQFHDDDTPDHSSVISYDNEDLLQMSQHSTHSRKRKRGTDHAGAMSHFDEQHLAYADELLDYFMLSSSDQSLLQMKPPTPPDHFNVDRAIDDQGHTALHWAAAMGDITVVRDLLSRGATMDAASNSGETPFMRAVLFTNNYEKQTMSKLTHSLLDTVEVVDYFGSTVFHHLAATTSSRSKFPCARYYCDAIIDRLAGAMSPDDLSRILDLQDSNGDTAVTMAARSGARKVARVLIDRGASPHLRNRSGENAEHFLIQLNNRKRERFMMMSSSPVRELDNNPLRSSAKKAISSTGLSQSASGHQSEAAMVLASTLAPVILEKSRKLAEAFDDELIEKDADLREAKRLKMGISEELNVVRQKTFGTLSTAEEDDVQEAVEREELERLERECEGALEQTQRAELEKSIQAEQGRMPHQHPNAPQLHEAELRDKLRAVAVLYREQVERRSLVKEMVQHQSLASVGTEGKGHSKYRVLIGKALGVDESKVEELIDGILGELEMGR